jgi:hypothetical protein
MAHVRFGGGPSKRADCSASPPYGQPNKRQKLFRITNLPLAPTFQGAWRWIRFACDIPHIPIPRSIDPWPNST